MLNYEEMSKFINIMEVKVNDHESRDCWSLVKHSDMTNEVKTILAICYFKRKIYPEGIISKYKARLCAHGEMQTWGENYSETYTSVVNCLSVWILFSLSVIHDLDARSIDFVLAFSQAHLDVDVFIELPNCFSIIPGKADRDSKGYVLKLNNSLYGLKWGFRQS